jgi:hypothetical protein
MKTPKWTKADAKRAEKMGWVLNDATPCMVHVSKHGDRFKSNDEAIAWVVSTVECNAIMAVDSEDLKGIKTCRKALFLCAKG